MLLYSLCIPFYYYFHFHFPSVGKMQFWMEPVGFPSDWDEILKDRSLFSIIQERGIVWVLWQRQRACLATL